MRCGGDAPEFGVDYIISGGCGVGDAQRGRADGAVVVIVEVFGFTDGNVRAAFGGCGEDA